MTESKEAIKERFESFLFKTKGCWFWKGPKQHGEPFLKIDGKTTSARKLSWEFTHKEKVEPTMVIKVSCFEQDCVNPDHLYLGMRTYGFG